LRENDLVQPVIWQGKAVREEGNGSASFGLRTSLAPRESRLGARDKRQSVESQLTLRSHMHAPVMPLEMLTPLERGAAVLGGAGVDLLGFARGGEKLALELLLGKGATTADDRGGSEGDGRLGDEGGGGKEDGRLTGGCGRRRGREEVSKE
jgi:hypothetical protein